MLRAVAGKGFHLPWDLTLASVAFLMGRGSHGNFKNNLSPRKGSFENSIYPFSSQFKNTSLPKHAGEIYTRSLKESEVQGPQLNLSLVHLCSETLSVNTNQPASQQQQTNQHQQRTANSEQRARRHHTLNPPPPPTAGNKQPNQ